MSYRLLEGSCFDVLPTLAEKSVQCVVTSPPYLTDVFLADILFAVYPMMADFAQGNNIVEVKTERWITGKRLDVMSAKTSFFGVSRTAADTVVIIPFVYGSNNLFPVARSIHALTFWRATIDVIRICFTRSAGHAVSFSTQPRLFYLSLITKYFLGFITMGFAKKRIDSIRSAHIAIIGVGEIVTAWPCRDTKVHKLFIDALRVTAYQFADVIRGKIFNHVFLIKPVSI